MTIREAITAVDLEKPSVFSDANKRAWLGELEAMVVREIIKTHAGGETAEVPAFDSSTPDDTVLTAPAPYDRLYPLYLAAQIDRMNGELGKYNSSITLFTAAYGEYFNWYNRTHAPLGTALRFW